MRENITKFIESQLLGGKHVVNGDTDLLISGLIDSMGVMRLVGFIEEKLQHTVPAEDVTLEHFATVDTICSYLESR
ncbi:MAG: acyl carrier protein [Pseudomonadota bacterium]